MPRQICLRLFALKAGIFCGWDYALTYLLAIKSTQCCILIRGTQCILRVFVSLSFALRNHKHHEQVVSYRPPVKSFPC